jgi:hypothetical protein
MMGLFNLFKSFDHPAWPDSFEAYQGNVQSVQDVRPFACRKLVQVAKTKEWFS